MKITALHRTGAIAVIAAVWVLSRIPLAPFAGTPGRENA